MLTDTHHIIWQGSVMNIADAIRVGRRRAGLSQRALAERVGVSGPAVAQWETGDKGISLANLIKVARVLELDLQDALRDAPPDDALTVTDPVEQAAIHALRQLTPGLRRAHVALMVEQIDQGGLADQHGKPAARRRVGD